MGIITPTENRILTDFDLRKEIPWELEFPWDLLH